MVYSYWPLVSHGLKLYKRDNDRRSRANKHQLVVTLLRIEDEGLLRLMFLVAGFMVIPNSCIESERHIHLVIPR